MRALRAIICAFVLAICLAGCQGSEYKKAVDLMNQDKWGEAKAIFQELGDYKDSPEMLNLCVYSEAVSLYDSGDYTTAREQFESLGAYKDAAKRAQDAIWGQLMEYTKANEPQYTNASDHSVLKLINAEDNLMCSYTINEDNILVVQLTLGITKDRLAILTGSSGFGVMGAKIEDDAEIVDWDIASYKKNGTIKWTSYDVSGNQWNGKPLPSGTKGLLGDNAKKYVTSLLGGLNKLLTDSGLDITMQDIGFTNY